MSVFNLRIRIKALVETPFFLKTCRPGEGAVACGPGKRARRRLKVLSEQGLRHGDIRRKTRRRKFFCIYKGKNGSERLRLRTENPVLGFRWRKGENEALGVIERFRPSSLLTKQPARKIKDERPSVRPVTARGEGETDVLSYFLQKGRKTKNTGEDSPFPTRNTLIAPGYLNEMQSLRG